MYLAAQPELKHKLLAEVMPTLEKRAAAGNLKDEFSYEDAQEFEYTHRVFYESLRIEPPASMSMMSCFTKDVNVGGVDIKANQQFSIAIESLHHNPE